MKFVVESIAFSTVMHDVSFLAGASLDRASACLSVRPSVTLVSHAYTVHYIEIKFASYDRAMFLQKNRDQNVFVISSVKLERF